MAWTAEQKAEAIKQYTDANPTAETSTEIIKQIADDMEQSANGVRMILVQAEVYVKKDAATTTKPATTKEGDAPKRVSKETSITALVKAITAAGGVVDNEILDKLTGKAAVYLTSVINTIVTNKE